MYSLLLLCGAGGAGPGRKESDEVDRRIAVLLSEQWQRLTVPRCDPQSHASWGHKRGAAAGPQTVQRFHTGCFMRLAGCAGCAHDGTDSDATGPRGRAGPAGPVQRMRAQTLRQLEPNLAGVA